ncbi:MAG: sigma-70 family RNA polymerase sigma factor [Pedobacter sp.]|nr:sigma-70 family RNA polymerase sigma factor [Pedobacter sp.]MDQ8054313.1 sigma-70 family RNA polymerase sigma factor [Pedobacter sp.]
MKALKVSHDDDELLHLLKEDNRDAFALIYQKYWSPLYNAAYKRLHDREQSQDVIQNLFTDLWLRREELDIKNLSAYLHTAVRFQVYKQAAKKPQHSILFTALEEILQSPFRSDSNLINEELGKIVELWIMALPEKRRKIFLMHYYEDLSTHEIAKQLNISQKTVQNQLNTASTYIRARFAHLLSVGIVASFMIK